MTYELAKELKDAGFPQGDSVDNLFELSIAADFARKHRPNHELIKQYELAEKALIDLYGKGVEEHVRIPTLSELIEACGTCQLSWYADAKYAQALSNNLLGEGTTPEEAVARLWLTLNKKV